MANDKYEAALIKARDNEIDRMQRKGTRSGALTNRRLGFKEGLEHAITLYEMFKEDNDGKS